MSFNQTHSIEQLQMKPVLLAPVTDSMQEDNNLEPQMVRIREGNNAFFAVDTDNRGPQIDSLDYRTIPVDTIFNSRVDKTRVRRLAVSQVRMNWMTPNVNPRNNRIGFETTTEVGSRFYVELDEGFYTTRQDLMDEVIVKMNGYGGAITFSHAINPLNPTVSVITAAGGAFRFIPRQVVGDPIPTAMLFGSQLLSLPKGQTMEASKTVGAIGLHYTRYVDFVSPDLNQYSKNTNSSNSNVSSGLVFRLYLDQDETASPRTVVHQQTRPKFFNWNRSDTFNTFRIILLDQYGQLLYVPRFDTSDDLTDPGPGGDQNDSGFFYNIFFDVEV